MDDFNNDGFPDLAVPGAGTGRVFILLNDGSGQFPTINEVLTGFTGVADNIAVATGNFNNDAFRDFAVGHTTSGFVTVHLGSATGAFTLSATLFVAGGGGGSFGSIGVEDFDNDGNDDIAASQQTFNDRVHLFFGDGLGGFPPIEFKIFAVPSRPMSMVTGDFNGDTFPDIAVDASLSNLITVLFGDNNGGFTRQDFPSGGGTADKVGRWGLAAANMNPLDPTDGGFTDLVVANTFSNTVSVLQGLGMDSFSLPIPHAAGITANSLDVVDFNGDDNPDIVITSRTTSEISVLIGDGFGNFSAPTVIPVGAPGGSLVLPAVRAADLDGDLILDLAVTNLAESTVSILKGTAAPGGGTNFAGPAGDFSTLFQNPDGTFTRTLKNGTRIEFDATGLQTAIIDRNGNTTNYAYDGQGRLTTITDPKGLVTMLAYAGDRLASVTDPALRVTSFAHDGDGNLTSITDPDLSLRQFAYDGRHRLTSQTSKRNFTTSYDYNFAGRQIQSNRPDGSTRKSSPSQTVGVIDTTGGAGAEANPAPYVRPNEVVATFTDGNDNVMTFSLSRFGSATEVIEPINAVTSRTTSMMRNSDSQMTSITEAVGTPEARTTSFTYDAKGNVLTRTKDSIGATTTFTYDPNFSQVTSVTDPNGNPSDTINLDANGNPIEVIDAAGTKAVLVYGDANCPGLVTSITAAQLQPEESVTTIIYDPLTCNLVSSTDPVGNVTTLAYDSKGNVIASTQAVGTPEERATRFVYDEMSRVVQSIDATNTDPAPLCAAAGVTCFTYDVAGNLTDVTDTNGNLTSFSYDTLDRVDSRTDPLLNPESFTYDGQGNLRFATDRKDQTLEFQYDFANRLIAKVLQPGTPAEVVRTIGYDLIDNIISVVDPDSSLAMTYDGANRLLSIATTGSPSQPDVTVTYSYDANGNRLTMTDNAGGSVSYVPDALNRVASLTNDVALQTITFGYDALSRRTSITRPNGVDTTLGYDAVGRLASIAHTLGVTAVSSFTYGHDALSNRNSLTQVRQALAVEPSLSFVYDAIDQLTQATHPLMANPAETFDYDPVGNRLLRDGEVTQSVFDAANRLSEDEAFCYTYDLNGNLDTKTAKVAGACTGGVTTYIFDAENRLVRIDFPDLTFAEYRYDGLGHRIEKNTNGVITRYVYDREEILLEYDGANALVARYTQGPGFDEPLLMERDLNADGLFDTTERFYYHADALGSVTDLTDNTGNVVRAYIYDSYGQIVDEIGTLANPYAYTARERDAENGLYFYRARYYDPRIGRFISEDPIGLRGGINTYAYTFNSPLNLTDPLGLEVLVCSRPVDINWIPDSLSGVIPPHQWIKTDTQEAGMGGECPVPGQECSDKPYSQTYTKSHEGQSSQPNAICEAQQNVDEACVNDTIRPGRSTGTWNIFNQCQSFVNSVIGKCRYGPQIGPKLPPATFQERGPLGSTYGP